MENLLVIVDIKEIRIQRCLNDPRHDRHRLKEAFREITIEPVGNVKCPIQSQGKEIVSSDRISFPCPLEHEQLGQNRYRFEPYGERPEDLPAEEVRHDRVPKKKKKKKKKETEQKHKPRKYCNYAETELPALR